MVSLRDKTGKGVHDWLRRIQFEVTPDLSDLRARQLATLGRLVTQPEDAYKALTNRWTEIIQGLSSLDTKSSAPHEKRLTRNDLFELITRTGSVRAPPRAEAELDRMFRRLSQVGRAWKRTIGTTHLPRSAIQAELTTTIAGQFQTALVYAGPIRS
jgi:hypothetical protein